MYHVNDYVVYGSTGVCQVVDICRKKFGQTDREYYVLNPVYGNTMQVYIPTDNQSVVMRRILSKDQLLRLVHLMPDIHDEWISDDQSRKATFNEALQSGDQKKMIKMIKMIYSRKLELENNGKRLTNTDSETMKAAEKLLYHEFALVFDINPEQVVPFITAQIAHPMSQ